MTRKNRDHRKVVSANRQFMTNITPMMPQSVNRSPKTVTTPEVNSSLTAYVAGDPGHQPSHRVPVEVGQVQPLQMAEDLPPQIEDDPLSRHLQQVDLAEADGKGRQQGQQPRLATRKRPAPSPREMWRSMATLVR